MVKKLAYTRDKCVACGVCAMLAPHIWQMSTFDGKAELLEFPGMLERVVVDLFPEDEKRVEEAVRNCPGNCIVIFR
jgi:ferredoxin